MFVVVFVYVLLSSVVTPMKTTGSHCTRRRQKRTLRHIGLTAKRQITDGGIKTNRTRIIMCFRYTSAGFRDRSCTKQYPFTCKMTAAGKHRARCRPSCCLSFTQYAYRLWDKLFERCQAEPQLLRLFAFYRRQIASCGISSSSSSSSQSSSLSSFLFAHTSTSYCMGPSKS